MSVTEPVSIWSLFAELNEDERAALAFFWKRTDRNLLSVLRNALASETRQAKLYRRVAERPHVELSHAEVRALALQQGEFTTLGLARSPIRRRKVGLRHACDCIKLMLAQGEIVQMDNMTSIEEVFKVVLTPSLRVVT